MDERQNQTAGRVKIRVCMGRLGLIITMGAK